MSVSEKDKAIVRDLAKQVAEIAADPIQQETIDLWKRHNSLERTRPSSSTTARATRPPT